MAVLAPDGTRTSSPSWRRDRRSRRVATLAVDLTPTTDPHASWSCAVQRWGRSTSSSTTRASAAPSRCTNRRRILDYFLGLMLRAPFRLARDVIPHMQSGSAIINVTSTFAVVGGLARRRLLGGQGRADRIDHPHRLPVRAAGNPLQRGSPRRHGDADGRATADGRAVPQDQHRDDALSAPRYASKTWRAPSRSCVRRAAASSTARRSSSTAAGVPPSTSRTSRCTRSGWRSERVPRD